MLFVDCHSSLFINFQLTERAEREVKQLKADVESKNRDIDRLNVAKNKIQTNKIFLKIKLSVEKIADLKVQRKNLKSGRLISLQRICLCLQR